MLWLWLFAGCWLNQGPAVPPETDGVWRPALTGGFGEGDLGLSMDTAAFLADGYQVQPVRFSLRPGFLISAAMWLPDAPNGAGIIVANGHYGQGKSGAEAQDIAHRMAHLGVTVLAVDTPGVEEWDLPGRQIHFEGGAHNRAWLAAAGSSAIALQLDILRRGVDVLQARGIRRITATGASGGAVQAAYLQLVDDRVDHGVFVSFPRMPREARASGCPCDQVPGHPGPKPAWLAAIPGDSFWMSDVTQERPAGLPKDARFAVVQGDHSYTEPMQRKAIAWWADHGIVDQTRWLDTVPAWDLSTGEVGEGFMTIQQLPVSRPALRWAVRPRPGAAYTVRCAGDTQRVLVLGGSADEQAQLAEAGFSPCEFDLVKPPGEAWDALAQAEAIGSAQPYADALVNAVQEAARIHDVRALWAVRGWGLVAAGSGIPFVVRDPLMEPAQVDSGLDAPWVHVPGAWWGTAGAQLDQAVDKGSNPKGLIAALKASPGLSTQRE